jgi:hypothetical protein
MHPIVLRCQRRKSCALRASPIQNKLSTLPPFGEIRGAIAIVRQAWARGDLSGAEHGLGRCFGTVSPGGGDDPACAAVTAGFPFCRPVLFPGFGPK